jgi:hypothetical protein
MKLSIQATSHHWFAHLPDPNLLYCPLDERLHSITASEHIDGHLVALDSDNEAL